MFVPFEDPLAESSDSPQRRKRAMQLILDEIHGLQRGWESDGDEWAGAGIINSSKVLVVTVSPAWARVYSYLIGGTGCNVQVEVISRGAVLM
jgi:hypothetical protein